MRSGWASWLEKTPWSPRDVDKASWRWACRRLAQLLPERNLTLAEQIVARGDAGSLAVARIQGHQAAMTWLSVVGASRYGSMAMPHIRSDRAGLLFAADRDGSGNARVQVSGGAYEPLPPFRVGDAFDWGQGSSAGARRSLAMAIIEEATGSHDAAFDHAERLADSFLAGAPKAKWTLDTQQLLAHL